MKAKYKQKFVPPEVPYPSDDYEWWAGPKGRKIAARIKRYKRWLVILVGVSVIEFITVAALVAIFVKIYNKINLLGGL